MRRIRGLFLMLDVLVLPVLILMAVLEGKDLSHKIAFDRNDINANVAEISQIVSKDRNVIQAAQADFQSRFDAIKSDMKAAEMRLTSIGDQLSGMLKIPPVTFPPIDFGPFGVLRIPSFDFPINVLEPIAQPLRQAVQQVKNIVTQPLSRLEGIDFQIDNLKAMANDVSAISSKVDNIKSDSLQIGFKIGNYVLYLIVLIVVFLLTRIPGYLVRSWQQFCEGWAMLRGKTT